MSGKKETASLEGGLTFGSSNGPYDGRQEKREARAAQPTSTDFFGDAIPPAQHGARLSLEFSYPPFSVLNARDGWWQERKREWLALGIQSELGRGDTEVNTPHHAGGQAAGLMSLRAEQKAARKRKANATPGGGAMPATNYSKNRARGDGRGRPIK